MKLLMLCGSLMMLIISESCSLNKIAMNAMADALSEGNGEAYTRDNDPQLVGEALPFGLKTMEVILESTPEHKGLLTATAAGFVQYGHAWVLYPAARLEYSDFTAWQAEKKRAKKFFLRARDYGLKALAVDYPDLGIQLSKHPEEAMLTMQKEDVPALYWTAAAWASALTTDKSDMSLVADLPIIKALMDRALELDEGWDEGAIHEFFIVFAASKPEAGTNGYQESKNHFNRAMELNGGRSISPIVALAESVCIPAQDRDQFINLLNLALEFDVDKYPVKRLANIIARQKAERLLSNTDRYFIQ